MLPRAGGCLRDEVSRPWSANVDSGPTISRSPEVRLPQALDGRPSAHYARDPGLEPRRSLVHEDRRPELRAARASTGRDGACRRFPKPAQLPGNPHGDRWMLTGPVPAGGQPRALRPRPRTPTKLESLHRRTAGPARGALARRLAAARSLCGSAAHALGGGRGAREGRVPEQCRDRRQKKQKHPARGPPGGRSNRVNSNANNDGRPSLSLPAAHPTEGSLAAGGRRGCRARDTGPRATEILRAARITPTTRPETRCVIFSDSHARGDFHRRYKPALVAKRSAGNL